MALIQRGLRHGDDFSVLKNFHWDHAFVDGLNTGAGPGWTTGGSIEIVSAERNWKPTMHIILGRYCPFQRWSAEALLKCANQFEKKDL